MINLLNYSKPQHGSVAPTIMIIRRSLEISGYPKDLGHIPYQSAHASPEQMEYQSTSH